MIDTRKLEIAHQQIQQSIPRPLWKDQSTKEKKRMIENKNRLVWWGHLGARKKLNKQKER